jgi:2-amino-4-hydroxy-6-hydroxymethyldihydropteridine diphosphokinase
MGGNMGDRMAFIKNSQTYISEKIGHIISESKVYESEAWGVENQNSFLNKILVVESELSSSEVLKQCLEIEKTLGRERFEKWTERKIDIDILYFSNEIINSNLLIVPHPEIQNRRFVLVPLCEISPSFVHPILEQTNSDLLEKCPDKLRVWEYV